MLYLRFFITTPTKKLVDGMDAIGTQSACISKMSCVNKIHFVVKFNVNKIHFLAFFLKNFFYISEYFQHLNYLWLP